MEAHGCWWITPLYVLCMLCICSCLSGVCIFSCMSSVCVCLWGGGWLCKSITKRVWCLWKLISSYPEDMVVLRPPDLCDSVNTQTQTYIHIYQSFCNVMACFGFIVITDSLIDDNLSDWTVAVIWWNCYFVEFSGNCGSCNWNMANHWRGWQASF